MVRIILSLENEKPQTYNFVRYATRYLSAIRSDVYQTESGIVHLTQSCELGLKHNDPIIVLGRVIAAGKIEGVIRKIDSLEVFYRMHNEIAGINDDRDNRGERHAKRERVAHMV